MKEKSGKKLIGIYIFGSGYNDIELLKKTGYGVGCYVYF